MPVEIPLKRKYLEHAVKKQKGGHDVQGNKHAHRRPLTASQKAALPPVLPPPVLTLLPSMKRRFVR